MSVRIIREIIFYIELYVDPYRLKSKQSQLCSILSVIFSYITPFPHMEMLKILKLIGDISILKVSW